MPDHSLTKMQLFEMQETFGSPKILTNLSELKTHHKPMRHCPACVIKSRSLFKIVIWHWQIS
jgi:hypothetical protein